MEQFQSLSRSELKIKQQNQQQKSKNSNKQANKYIRILKPHLLG